MAFPGAPTAPQLPLHVLFPADYEASKRAIVRDFAFFGSVIVGTVLIVAMVGSLVS
jgi:hypothetical protein